MRAGILSALSTTLILITTASLGGHAQQGQANQQGQTKKEPKTITLSGCVETDDTAPDRFTLTDTKEGQKYRLTGRGLRAYLGRPVEIDGGIVVQGVRVKGGLLPNPNVAAQAGAMDPARAAIATATSAPTGVDADVQEFRVKTIRKGSGSCSATQEK